MATTTLITGQTVVVLNPAAVNLMLNGDTGPVVRDLFVRGERVKVRAVQLCPKKTGNLAAHHVKRLTKVANKPVMLVGVESVPYALFVHEGTRPHDIRPKNASVLAFTARDGTQVFTKLVHHPGTKPQRWLAKALPAAL